MKKFEELLLVIFFTLLPGSALAARTTAENLQNLDFTVSRGVTPEQALPGLASRILDQAPFFLTIVAFAAFLYSGAMYALALGDANKMETAKKNLGWALIGMVSMSLVLVGIRIVAFLAGQTARFTVIPNL